MTLSHPPLRTPALLVGAALLFALLLAVPGETVTTVYVNDLFIFLDGAYRVAWGQVPNRDFHTALGPLVYYIPAAGYWASGTLGGAMPVGMAFVVAALGPIVAFVIGSRMRPVVALPYGLFVLLVLAVPMNLGESIGSLSFAMYYNRIGWVGLGILLVMYLRPLRPVPGQTVWDALCATVLVVLLLYTKVTYGLVALAFVAFMLLEPQQRRWAAATLGLTVVAGVIAELLWGASLAHLADLALTGRVSGSRGPVDLTLVFLRHLADYVMFGILAALALWRSRHWRDLVFFGICAGPGLLIVSQNSQPWGIITLHAGTAIAAEMLLREEPPGEGARRAPVLGAPFAMLALVLPTALHCFLALALHAGLAAAKAGEPFGLPGFERIRLARLWSPGDDAFSTAYLQSLREGARALAALPTEPRHVSVLDFVNPFSAGLGLPPPQGDNAWLHWGRNINAEHYLPPEQLLGGVEVLMQPKWGINNLPLIDLYGDYVRAAFEPVLETETWIVHRRREGGERGRQMAQPRGP